MNRDDDLRLLILGDILNAPLGTSPKYRGTYRGNPTFAAHLPIDHELNTLFKWYTREGGETGVVHNATNAVRYASLSNEILGSHFEVVEVVDDSMKPQIGTRLLGYDLAEGYCNSLLRWGLRNGNNSALPQAIQVKLVEVSERFMPLLNSSGLFSSENVAGDCLRSMMALQNECPNLYEGGSLDRFTVTGVYLVWASAE